MTRVLFVCTGNICRSPMAEAVFRHLVQEAGLADQIAVDSAATDDWHVGSPPHRGTLRVLQKHGIPGEGMLARAVEPKDFEEFDHIVGMAWHHLGHLRRMARPNSKAKLRLLLDGVPGLPVREVPDPYYDGRFQYVFDLVLQGCRTLLADITDRRRLIG